MGMVMHFFFFVGLMTITEMIIEKTHLVFKTIRMFGSVALSSYYAHIIFIHSINLGWGALGLGVPRQEWGILHWCTINLVFWICSVAFVRMYWRQRNYIGGLEWFMSKYISTRSVVSVN